MLTMIAAKAASKSFRRKPSEATLQSSHLGLRILVTGYHVIGRNLHINYQNSLLEELRKRGHNVTWISAQTYSSKRETREVPRYKLDTLTVRKFVPVISLLLFQLFSFWRVVRSLGRCDAVVLDVYIMPVLFPILLIRRLASHSPVILLRVLGNPVETGGPLRDLLYSFLYAFSIKLSATFFDKILFISPMLAQSYSAQLEIPENKIAVSPSSVDTSVFDPLCTKKAERLRRELDLSDRLGVLYHGVLTRSRGIVETVRAFRILNDESVKAKLILLGDGPAKEGILRYVQENNLGKVIQVCGPVDYCDVPDYIAACDVGIVPLPDHPWYRYQCPLKLLEDLAMKKPVIVSDIPANRSIVDDLPVAVYLHGTSPRQIADGIHAFQQSGKSLHPELGRQIAEMFSAERVAEMLEAQIRSFID